MRPRFRAVAPGGILTPVLQVAAGTNGDGLDYRLDTGDTYRGSALRLADGRLRVESIEFPRPAAL